MRWLTRWVLETCITAYYCRPGREYGLEESVLLSVVDLSRVRTCVRTGYIDLGELCRGRQYKWSNCWSDDRQGKAARSRRFGKWNGSTIPSWERRRSGSGSKRGKEHQACFYPFGASTLTCQADKIIISTPAGERFRTEPETKLHACERALISLLISERTRQSGQIMHTDKSKSPKRRVELGRRERLFQILRKRRRRVDTLSAQGLSWALWTKSQIAVS